MDEGKEVVVAFIVASCDGAELLEFAEEALDEVAQAIEEGAEGGTPLAVRHGSNIGPSSTRGEFEPERVGIIGAVGEQHVTFADGIELIGRAASVVRLAGGEA